MISAPNDAFGASLHAVAYWNNFFSALLYITDNAKYPLALVLRTYVIDNATISTGDASQVPPQQSLQMAMLVVSILAVYPFPQKHFAKGIMIGAVKG